MNLYLRRLVITNFKGIKSLEINFNQVTNIYGNNGTGKTTAVPDALPWLLYGKDSQGRAQFDIKNTKDTSLNRGEHSVYGEFFMDQQELTLQHTFKENWVTRKGNHEAVFDGNTHTYEVNGVPKSLKEYTDIVNGIVPEHILKLVTNPLFFPAIPWADQRNILIDLAGDIPNDQILDRVLTVENKGDFDGLVKFLNSNTTITNKVAEYKKMLASKIKNIKDEHITIGPKIQERIHSKPEPVNEALVRLEITTLQDQIEQLNKAIHDDSSSEQSEKQSIQKINLDIIDLNGKIQTIKSQVTNEYNTEVLEKNQGIVKLRSDIRNLRDTAESLQSSIDSKQRRLNNLLSEREQLSAKWDDINESEIKFKEGEFECGTCKRPYPADDIEKTKAELTENFNNNKNNQLDKIEETGAKLKHESETLQSEIDALKIDFAKNATEITNTDELLVQALNAQKSENIITVEERLTGHADYSAIVADLSEQKSKLDKRPAVSDRSDLKQELQNLTNKLDAEKRKLSVNDDIKKIDERIEELKSRESDLAQQIASFDRENFAIEKFIVAKVDAIQDKINSRFTIVTFKLFDKQQNGGIKEACECVVDSVAYSMLNTGMQLNAGLDIINALSAKYDVYAPIIIDNRESTTSIIPVQSQLVNMYVSKDDKKLRIE